MSFNKLRTRLKTCYNILTGKYQHWVLLNTDRQGLIEMLTDSHESFNVDIANCGLRTYNAIKLIRLVASQYDVDDMTLMKAEFMAKAEEQAKNYPKDM